MPNPIATLSMTRLVKIVHKSGFPKITEIRKAKDDQAKYDPKSDYWKKLRDRVVDAHEKGLGPAHVQALLATPVNEKKEENYRKFVSNYVSWWGDRELPWWGKVGGTFTSNGFDVRVNPELGLTIDGENYAVKLYLAKNKEDKLTTSRLGILGLLMHRILGPQTDGSVKMGVLDVGSSKLHTLGPGDHRAATLLEAEMACIAAAWPTA